MSFHFLIILCALGSVQHRCVNHALLTIDDTQQFAVYEHCVVAAVDRTEQLMKIPGWRSLVFGTLCVRPDGQLPTHADTDGVSL